MPNIGFSEENLLIVFTADRLYLFSIFSIQSNDRLGEVADCGLKRLDSALNASVSTSGDIIWIEGSPTYLLPEVIVEAVSIGVRQVHSPLIVASHGDYGQ